MQLKRYNDTLTDFSIVSDMIKIIIKGEPMPKGRARARIVTPRTGKQFISFYTPRETELYEQAISYAALKAMQGHLPFDCSCEAIVLAYISVPESWSCKKHAQAIAGNIKPLSKPDSDNYLKAAMDALNGIVFVDDGRVWKMTCEKHYSENPRLEIIITKTLSPTLI